MKTKVLGICGGKGKMATWFIHHFKGHFKEIIIYDVDSEISLEKFVSSCDLILVSVPIFKTVDVIEKIGKFCRKDQLLLDFTSLKEASCSAMAKLPCHSIGLHPLFGPKAQKSDFKVVLCQVKSTPWIEKITELFEDKEITVIEMSSKEHDQSMALVQSLNHGLQLAFGTLLINEDMEGLLALRTPSFTLFTQGLQNIIRNDPKLYRDIAFENPYFLEALKKFQGVMSKYTRIVEEKNELDFDTLFNDLKSQFNFREAL